jgi:hypothetical protein
MQPRHTGNWTRSPPTKTTPLKCDRPAQPKHTIAEGRLQMQPLAQAQTVIQLLKQTLEQGKTEAIITLTDIDVLC